jgi:hypothetical protein
VLSIVVDSKVNASGLATCFATLQWRQNHVGVLIQPLPCEDQGLERCNISCCGGKKKARLSFRQKRAAHSSFLAAFVTRPQADQIGVDCNHIFTLIEITVNR